LDNDDMTSNNVSRALAIIAAKAVFGASLAVGFASMPAAHADTTTSITLINQFDDSVGSMPADDIEEDQPGWDCATMGNRVCGSYPSDDNSIVRLADGTLDDCTVTDAKGDRADFHQECDDYWSWT
jgi:hypothetical protein